MRRLFLHVGTGKTGSSALQYAFSVASADLAHHGIRYPESADMRSKVLNRVPTAGNARSVRQALKHGPGRALDEMRSLIGDSGDVLLSNESLYEASPDYLAAVADLLAGLGVQAK